MAKKIKIINKIISLILIGFLISCGVKGDPKIPQSQNIKRLDH